MLSFHSVENAPKFLLSQKLFSSVPLHLGGRNVTKFLLLFCGPKPACHFQAYPIILPCSGGSWSVSQNQRIRQFHSIYKGWSHRQKERESCWRRTVGLAWRRNSSCLHKATENWGFPGEGISFTLMVAANPTTALWPVSFSDLTS